ncbi:hypothetical protein GGX14DRAFT_399663 [Mycena pura]|uniref:Uncharacterized protein n=1 Tax=Mycena pura TaxID=153505 RepID=A0AAD6V7R0_9AGAR|nr:hypothetical protein GGX14DRAFT_399663 [Mycena pura]
MHNAEDCKSMKMPSNLLAAYKTAEVTGELECGRGAVRKFTSEFFMHRRFHQSGKAGIVQCDELQEPLCFGLVFAQYSPPRLKKLQEKAGIVHREAKGCCQGPWLAQNS